MELQPSLVIWGLFFRGICYLRQVSIGEEKMGEDIPRERIGVDLLRVLSKKAAPC